mgnify:CR=1 FL=1
MAQSWIAEARYSKIKLITPFRILAFAPYRNDRVILFGGTNGSGNLEARLDHYNARHQFWPTDSATNMPAIRRRAIALSLGFDKIVVVGGLQSPTNSDRLPLFIVKRF